MLIRQITLADSSSFLDLCKTIDSETPNMLLGKNERNLTVLEQEKKIEISLKNPKSNIWVVEDKNRLVGYLIASGNIISRKKHSVYIVIGILKEFTNKKIGTALMHTLFDWSKENRITRIELTVRRSNILAISLYTKMGFIEEGIKRNSLYINSKYEDELYMAKIFT